MSGRRGRALVLGAALVSLALGCRDLVAPDIVTKIGPTRTIEGTIGTLRGFATVPGRISLRTIDAQGLVGSPPLATADLDTSGAFRVVVPRGTSGAGVVEVEWNVQGQPATYSFGNVPLAGVSMVLDYAPRRLAGRLLLPDGLDFTDESVVYLDFDEETFLPPSGSLLNDVFFSIGADGVFDLVLPDRAWDVWLRGSDVGGLDELTVRYGEIEVRDDLELPLPIAPLELRVEAPQGLEPDVEFALQMRADPRDDRVEIEFRTAATSGVRSTWRPVEAADAGVTVREPTDREVVFVDAEIRPSLAVAAPGEPVTVDLGDALLRVVVLRGGSALTDARVEVPWFGDSHPAFTASEGIVDYVLPSTGPYLVEVSHDDDRVVQEIEVDAYTEWIVDLGSEAAP